MKLQRLPLCLVLTLAASGCGDGPAASKPAAPVHSEVVAHEGELLKLTLTRQAQARLGIATVRIGTGSAAATRETSGEIVVPAGAGGVPTDLVSNLQQLGVQQVESQAAGNRRRSRYR